MRSRWVGGAHRDGLGGGVCTVGGSAVHAEMAWVAVHAQLVGSALHPNSVGSAVRAQTARAVGLIQSAGSAVRTFVGFRSVRTLREGQRGRERERISGGLDAVHGAQCTGGGRDWSDVTTSPGRQEMPRNA